MVNHIYALFVYTGFQRHRCKVDRRLGLARNTKMSVTVILISIPKKKYFIACHNKTLSLVTNEWPEF
ncbi:hypothetical protein KL86SPO_50690 [uncultured Sporomusa sp.]|uniref:Uncharacterized protein n=1 Tax=uncultured Sporomusa sp. TaxID=307249 RepID=A0A212LZG8_9FIRM|nr:hypothetical protein KL86SPO_50690 [uncultured Sporomusa sp.]